MRFRFVRSFILFLFRSQDGALERVLVSWDLCRRHLCEGNEWKGIWCAIPCSQAPAWEQNNKKVSTGQVVSKVYEKMG